MKLWKLTDGSDVCIVRAETDMEARALLKEQDGTSDWINAAKTTCEEIPVDGAPEWIDRFWDA